MLVSLVFRVFVYEDNRLLTLTSGGALEGAATARCHGFAGPKVSSPVNGKQTGARTLKKR